jgi:PAT family beta-lactamase induction signal transducer AmpG
MSEAKQLKKSKNRSGWFWVPTLYYFEGIPYNVAMIISVVMYKKMGIPNSAIAFWTSILYLPWTLKPLWSPYIDAFSTKRNWIVITQFILSVALFCVALTVQLPLFFTITLIVFWIVAFSSATHDIAADGFYMLGLDSHQQAWFVGIRSTFYRLATITAIGLIPMLAGYIEANTGLESVDIEVQSVPYEEIDQIFNPDSIKIKREEQPHILYFPKEVKVPLYQKGVNEVDSTNIYFILSAPPVENESIVVNFGRSEGSKDIFLESAVRFVFTSDNWNIPRKATIKVHHNLKERRVAIFTATAGDIPFSWAVSFGVLALLLFALAIYHRFILPYPSLDKPVKGEKLSTVFVDVFVSFFKKKGVVVSILFLLLYRLAESQLVKLAAPFLLDAQETGGLALTTGEYGFAYGTVGVVALVVGGLLGGFSAAKYGLKKWIWWMAIAINLPDAVYLFLAYTLPDSYLVINLCIAIEQFGYGFGFTGYMLYQLYIAGTGKYKAAHFAITTAFMALGMMIPGMFSGKIQEILGYQHFFVWVMLCTIPSFVVIKFLKIDPGFGKKKS